MAFMIGLKPKVRKGVKMFEPRTLKKMMSLSRMVEDWDGEEGSPSSLGWESTSKETTRATWDRFSTCGSQLVGSGSVVSSNKTLAASETKTTQYRAASEKNLNPQTKTPANRRQPFRQLTDAEANERRSKGLCFRCDERYHAGHRCRLKELQVLVVAPDEEEETEMEKDGECVEEEVVVPKFATFSMRFAAGISSPRTIKIRGTVLGENVVVMIDSRATHNFLSRSMAHRFGITTKGTVSYRVRMGTGLLVNWKEQRLGFMVGQEWVTFRGDHNLRNSAVSLKALWKAVREEGEGVWVDYGSLHTELQKGETVTPAELQSLLEDFAQIFAEPQGLPPSREKEHTIILKPGAEPVSVRLFRYPEAQKEEIERQIAVMLAAGIIRESGSPFSSPVLLVKKKYGSWRFYVDYHALNKATVLDSYPISMIDQLLDELHGARVFSKLDLRSGYHQIRVRSEDIPKTAFRSHDGHVEFFVMPFGLTNAPATFQSLMNDIFRPFMRWFVLVFFDDILFYIKSLVEHKEHLKEVLQMLHKYSLYANHKKCQFGSDQIE
ncbi:PREDICTED: uncharacterized protein LOC104704478 [Camelina sativa]|uniref:Uncharacterized protein LOC104704478 n=1 Tax=Camelina sativa TaxID=90675 RepID=A0ABM0T0E3_CAMSA|nr:PREDICTED: uncharacterized protein LOC104704478 [Camelina sativa]